MQKIYAFLENFIKKWIEFEWFKCNPEKQQVDPALASQEKIRQMWRAGCFVFSVRFYEQFYNEIVACFSI